MQQGELEGLRVEMGRLFAGRHPLFQLTLAEQGRETPVWVGENGGLYVALLFVTFEGPGEDTVRDVKEQEMYLGELARWPVARWLAYVEGTLRALPAIVELLGGEPEVLMPYDLFSFGRVLDDASLVTADEFAAALSDPARLAAMTEANVAESWKEALEPCGLADQVAAVRAMFRPALRLELERAYEEDAYAEEDEDEDEDEDGEEAVEEVEELVVGESRVGGHPDLPPGMAWPEVDGRPLMFVAQIDLAAISRYPAARELPDHGLLSFFYDPFGADDLSHPVRVVHITETAALAPRRPPEGVELITAHTVRFTPERVLPAVESYHHYYALLPAERVLPWYAKFAAGDGSNPPIDEYALARMVYGINERDSERPIHQLLGHPDSIQGDPYLDVEMTTHPGGWDAWRDGTLEAQDIRDRALRWRLLLQIDATQDGELLLNQDGGFFYFWIPDDALAARDWSRVRGSLQCH